ncbi:MAG: hypothetical protein ABIO37_06515, partial [Caulobacteraceae bacterium]
AIANLVTGTTVGIIGATGVRNGDLYFSYAIPFDAATLNISGGANPAAVTITSAPAIVTVNSTGTVANTVTTLRLGGVATALVINAEADLSIGAITGLNGTTASITIAGSAPNAGPGVAPGISLGVLSTNVGQVTASGLTSTGITTVIGANPALNLTGGAGADLILVGAGQGAAITGVINGGAGTSDVIAFATGADLAAGSAAKFVGFETLSVGNFGAASTLQAYDVSLFSPVAIYGIGGFGGVNTGSIQLNNLPTAQPVSVYSNVSGTNAAGGLSLRIADASGAADAITLQLDNLNATTAPNVSGVTVSGLALGGNATAGQIETLNIVSAGKVTGTGTANAVSLVNSGASPNFADPNTIKVTGSQALSLTLGTLVHGVTVDASADTGGISFSSLAGATGAPFIVTVNGSTVNDTIQIGATQTTTVVGGTGGDAILIGLATRAVTIAYKAAAESLMDLTGTSGLGGTGKMDTISGFVSGLDKIRLNDIAPAFNAPQIIVDGGQAASAADAAILLSNPSFFMDATNTVRKVAQFDYIDGTMLVADTNANGIYDSGDLVVYLLGVTNVVNSDLVGS